MKLDSIFYVEHECEKSEWKLEECNFSNIKFDCWCKRNWEDANCEYYKHFRRNAF
jgi:hypothetical protein